MIQMKVTDADQVDATIEIAAGGSKPEVGEALQPGETLVGAHRHA